MSVAKSPNQWGVMVELEGTYGGGATMVLADDGVLVLEAPEVEPGWVNDGDRGIEVRRGGKSGLSGAVDIVTEFLTQNVAFSATIFPPNIHDLLRGSGHIATGDFTPASETWVYTPDSDITAWDSVAAEVYIDGEKTIFTGAYAGLTISSESGEVPLWSFPLMGIMSLPIDAAVPTIVYDELGAQPPKAVGMTVNIGDYATAVVRSFEFNKNNADPTARMDEQVADLHAGFAGVIATPTLELVIERTALATTPFHKTTGLDPRTLEKLASQITVDLSWGSVQYGICTLNIPLAELVEVSEDREGSISTWTLTFECRKSAPLANDAYNIAIT